jgi:hypothetical protein
MTSPKAERLAKELMMTTATTREMERTTSRRFMRDFDFLLKSQSFADISFSGYVNLNRLQYTLETKPRLSMQIDAFCSHTQKHSWSTRVRKVDYCTLPAYFDEAGHFSD